MDNIPLRLETMDNTIRDICLYLGDHDASRLYMVVAGFLKTVLRQVNLHTDTCVKSTNLTIQDNLTADLPSDFEQLTKVGLCCPDGRLRPLYRDDTLCLKQDDPIFKCCDCKTDTTQNKSSCNKCGFRNFTYSGSGYGYGIFGTGRSPYLYGYTVDKISYGIYRVDLHNHRLQFGGGCASLKPNDQVVLEYKTSLTEDDFRLIEAKAIPMLQHRVAQYYYAATNPNQSMLENRLFRTEHQMYKSTKMDYTLEDIVTALQAGYFAAPKL